MPIRVVCPDCEHSYTLIDEQAGKKVRCKSCQSIFVASARPTQRAAEEEDDEDEAPRGRPRRAAVTAAPPARKERSTAVRRDEDELLREVPAPPWSISPPAESSSPRCA
jgi:predicted Zn finger-like uncharacterized protein